MSPYAYLGPGVKEGLEIEVAKALKESLIKTPPLSVDDLYDKRGLKSRLLSPRSPELVDYERRFGTTESDPLRGVLFLDKKLVIVNDCGYKKRNKFVYGHEYAHWHLPSHRDLLFFCTQFDLSRSEEAHV